MIPHPITLIGAPTDVGASVLGASIGPDALRVAGLAQALRARGLEVVDHGNLPGPANPQHEPVDGFRHLAEVTAWNQAVFASVRDVLAAGRIVASGGPELALKLEAEGYDQYLPPALESAA